MGNASAGSIAADAQLRLDSPSSTVSGAMVSIAQQSANAVGNYVGVSFGSPAVIADKYQPAVLYFTLAEASQLMSLTGAKKGYSLGELSVDENGAGGATDSAAQYHREKAQAELRSLGQTTNHYRTY